MIYGRPLVSVVSTTKKAKRIYIHVITNSFARVTKLFFSVGKLLRTGSSKLDDLSLEEGLVGF